jgi:hypothetical protein
MSKKSGKSPLHVSGPIRPKAPAGIGYHPHRAIHGNASVKTTERKVAPKPIKRAK